MTFVITALIIFLLVAVGLLFLVRSQRQSIGSLDELTGRAHPIDIEAFFNLLDPAETLFLRQNLSLQDFREVQRERTLAVLEYVRKVAHNAALLASLGQLARDNPDPQLAQAAHIMVEQAAHVRMLCLMVMIKVHASRFIPAAPLAADDIFRDYRRLTESAVLFTKLQRPAFAGRVAAVL
jgi:hypothetical protein